MDEDKSSDAVISKSDWSFIHWWTTILLAVVVGILVKHADGLASNIQRSERKQAEITRQFWGDKAVLADDTSHGKFATFTYQQDEGGQTKSIEYRVDDGLVMYLLKRIEKLEPKPTSTIWYSDVRMR